MVSITTPRITRSSTIPVTPESLVKSQEIPASGKKRLNGTWRDGHWWCNCEPRRQATLRQVKKDGPNKGKFFWTCATYPFCKLFLWEDEATSRQRGLPESNQTADDGENNWEQPQRLKTPSFTQQPLESFGILTSPSRRRALSGAGGSDGKESGYVDTSFGSTQTVRGQASGAHSAGATTPCSPRKRGIQDVSDDSDSFGDLDSDEERILAQLADPSAKIVAAAKNPPATPSTSRRTTDLVAGLPTPSVSRTLFPTSEAKKSKTVSFENPSPSGRLATPTKKLASTSDASAMTPSSRIYDTTEDLSEEIMTLLRGQKVDPGVLRKVQALMDTAARRTKGIAKSRDAALQSKDKKIATLNDKIRDLENKAKLDFQNATETKRKIMDVYHGI